MVLPPGEFNGMSSQSHVSHCRVLPLGEFTVMIPEPHATLQGAATWQNQCHDRATLQGVIIPSAILKIVFRHILFYFVFNAVWALTSGSFRIVSNTLTVYNLLFYYYVYRKQQRRMLYSTAVNMKLLMDMPEMVTRLF